MANIDKTQTLVKLTQSLFFLMAAVWLLIGIISIFRMSNRSPEGIITAGIIAILMFGNAAAMLLCGWGLGKGYKRFHYFALLVVIVNIILTVTDEFGIVDLITLLIDMGIFGLLIAIRKRYAFSAWSGSQ